MSLSTILIASTTSAKIKDPLSLENTKNGMVADLLNPPDWLLIEESTLRAITKDASGYRLSLEKLNEAQEKQIKDVEEVNLLRLEKYEVEKSNYRLQVENYELNNPPWYKSPVLWGSVGVAAGMVIGGIVVGYASGGL